MAIFIIIPTQEGPGLAGVIASSLPGKYYSLPRGEFLVAFSGTSKDLSDHLHITEGVHGGAIVASMSGYYGRAPNDVWEWITHNFSA